MAYISVMDFSDQRAQRQPGFSLIELLVVVAIIVVLLALLMPSVRRMKEKALESQCMVNMRSLQTAHTGYSTDNDGVMPGAQTAARGRPSDWVQYENTSNLDRQKENLRVGSLWKYLNDYKVYQCPRYPRDIRFANHVRHYSLNNYLNGRGWGYPIRTTVGGVVHPSKAMSFIEEPDPRKGLAGSWVTSTAAGKWVDPIGFWHSNGAVFAFLDGHIDKWTWYDARTLSVGFSFFANTPNNPDLDRIKAHSAPGEPLAPPDWNK